MKLLPLATLLMTIILLTGCEKKYKPTIIEGYILETGTDKPIEGVIVPIHIRRVIDRKSISYPIDTVYSDASGKFYWESTEYHEPLGIGEYEIGRIKKEKYFSLNWAFSLYQEFINENRRFKQTIHLDPHAYLHLHVEDVPEIEGSYVRFGGTMFSNHTVELYGEDYENTLLVIGNRRDKTRFNFTFKEGPNVSMTDSLLVPAHDTLYYHLKY